MPVGDAAPRVRPRLISLASPPRVRRAGLMAGFPLGSIAREGAEPSCRPADRSRHARGQFEVGDLPPGTDAAGSVPRLGAPPPGRGHQTVKVSLARSSLRVAHPGRTPVRCSSPTKITPRGIPPPGPVHTFGAQPTPNWQTLRIGGKLTSYGQSDQEDRPASPVLTVPPSAPLHPLRLVMTLTVVPTEDARKSCLSGTTVTTVTNRLVFAVNPVANSSLRLSRAIPTGADHWGQSWKSSSQGCDGLPDFRPCRRSTRVEDQPDGTEFALATGIHVPRQTTQEGDLLT